MARFLRALPSFVWIVLLAPGAARGAIVINEVMYNSPGATDVEYVELFNTGPAAQDLTGWYLLDDDDAHDRCMLVGLLDPGEYLVVAGTISLFMAAYPGVTPVNPNPFESAQPGSGFSLGNTSDEVRLFDAFETLVDVVPYTDSDPWPTAADGNGPSLELVNPALDNSQASAWSASAGNGTPGAQNSVFVADLAPAIDSVERDIALPGAAQTVTVTARVTDDQGLVAVELWVDSGSGFAATPMLDDGLHGDGAPGDSVFGATIDPEASGTLVRYYVLAQDTLPQESTEPPGAPAVYLAYTVDYLPPVLRINELLASNQNGIRDEANQRDDWLELRNPGPSAVQLEGMFLSNDRQASRMWPFPAVTLPPGGYLIVWCDEETTQGLLHANFRLPLAGGEVALFDGVDHGNVLIHAVTYGLQSPDRSFGYAPQDSDAPEYLATPTPLADNRFSPLLSSICINEFLTASQVGVPDWVELYNRGSLSIDIGGYFLTDDAAVPQRYTFPPSSVVAPGGTLSIDQATLGFGLDANGSEVLQLTHSNAITALDYFDYGPQFSDVSQGRYRDGTPNWHFFSSASRDLPNSCDQGAPVPGPVANLRFTANDSLAWDASPQATRYDVLRGDIATLAATEGDFTVSINACLENNSPDSSSFDPQPPPGAGFFYLVRGTTSFCGFGTYDSGGAGQAEGRDPEIDGAALRCP